MVEADQHADHPTPAASAIDARSVGLKKGLLGPAEAAAEAVGGA